MRQIIFSLFIIGQSFHRKCSFQRLSVNQKIGENKLFQSKKKIQTSKPQKWVPVMFVLEKMALKDREHLSITWSISDCYAYTTVNFRERMGYWSERSVKVKSVWTLWEKKLEHLDNHWKTEGKNWQGGQEK